MLMSLRMYMAAAVVVLGVVGLSACSMAEFHHEMFGRRSDPLSGEWNATFNLEGYTAPFALKLKLEGDKVSGTCESEHTGPGTLRNGKWTNNKLSCDLDFASHESIALTGILKDGVFSGEFRTEGRQGSWEARKK